MPILQEAKDGTLLEGVLDLAYREVERARGAYEEQVGLYARAVSEATGGRDRTGCWLFCERRTDDALMSGCDHGPLGRSQAPATQGVDKPVCQHLLAKLLSYPSISARIAYFRGKACRGYGPFYRFRT
jgi:hypothetical protein